MRSYSGASDSKHVPNTTLLSCTAEGNVGKMVVQSAYFKQTPQTTPLQRMPKSIPEGNIAGLLKPGTIVPSSSSSHAESLLMNKDVCNNVPN